MPPDTLWDNNALNLALPLDNWLLPTGGLIGTLACCRCGARQADPLLALAVDKDDFIFPSAEQVAYDQVVRVSVKRLTAFV